MRNNGMLKNTKAFTAALLAAALMLSACGSGAQTKENAPEPVTQEAKTEEVKTEEAKPEEVKPEEAKTEEKAEETEIQVFIAASLGKVMDEVAKKYNEIHPEVKIVYNADSSGTLQTQIEEGYACDIFFSAATKQMDALDEKGFVTEGSRHDLLNNKLVVLTLKDSGTKVTGLADIEKASSIALADGSVPAGRYTRKALQALGKLPEDAEAAEITTAQVSEALGGVEISEQSNVSKVLSAVVEGSCEVGTTYYSDTYGFEDKVDVIEVVDSSLTGNVIYPVAQINNDEADEAEVTAASDFLSFLVSDEAKGIFDSYYFDTDVK